MLAAEEDGDLRNIGAVGTSRTEAKALTLRSGSTLSPFAKLLSSRRGQGGIFGPIPVCGPRSRTEG
jgi:hypothetical protein